MQGLSIASAVVASMVNTVLKLLLKVLTKAEAHATIDNEQKSVVIYPYNVQ